MRTLFSDEEAPRLWTPDDWATPLEVRDCVAEFARAVRSLVSGREQPRIELHEPICDLDMCSNPWSIIRARVEWRREDDATTRPWWQRHGGPARNGYCNPPYSDPTAFVRECSRVLVGEDLDEWAIGLLKLDPSTEWWKKYVRPATSKVLVDERLDFRRPDGRQVSNNFCSAVALWSPRVHAAVHRPLFAAAFERLGEVV